MAHQEGVVQWRQKLVREREVRLYREYNKIRLRIETDYSLRTIEWLISELYS